MTKKGKRTALLQRTEQVAELQRENEQLRARLAAPEKTDEKLRQSEERYRLLADNASDVIWIADVDLNMTYVSPSAARMLGCSMNELMTPAVSDLLLPESVRLRIKDFADQVASERRHLGRSARELTLETRLQLRDGSTIWVEQRIDFIRDEAGRLTGVMGITRDVTDRRLAEEELRASEARNRLLIENANEGILVVQDEVIKFANPKFAEISGYSMQGLVSKPALDLFHSDDRQMIQGYYFRRIKGERFPHVYPIRLLDRAGKTKWVEVNAVMLDWGGRPAVLALVTDLTERRAAQQALEESERKYRALAEESIQGLVVAQGLPPRFVYCNAAMAGMTGYTVEELVAMSPEQFAALIHPEDREMVFKRFTESPAGGATEEHLQFRGLRRDGREVWLEMAATTVEYQGAPAVQAALIDVTERKMAEEALRANEEKFRQITENMLDAVSLVDKDGIIRYVSPSHEGILGYKPEDLVGTSVFEPIFPEDRDGVMAALDEILKKREGRFQYRFRHADGHYVWGEASARIMVDDDGNMSGAVIASRDITDRKKAEEALKDSEAKYKRLFESTQTAMEVISMETGLVVLANEAMAKLFGVASADDLVGIDSVQYLRPEDVGWVSSKMAQAVADNSWREIEELQVRRADGRWIWVSGTARQSEYQGKPALLVSLLDVTGRKQAEQTLRESEEKFRLLTERTNDMVWTTDLSLRTTYISPSVEKLLGFTPEERIGVETSAQVTPESMARAQQLLLEQLEMEREGKADPNRTLRIDLEYYHKNGSTVWLEALVGGIRDENGTLIAVHGVSRDVSERRKAEQALRDSEAKYRRVFEGTQVGMEIISGETGLVVMANEAMARIFGFRSPDDMIGRDSMEYLAPEDREWAAKGMADVLADKSMRVPGEVRARTEDGRWIWISAMAVQIEYEGKPAFLVSIVDVTRRREAEDALRVSEQKYRLLTEQANDVIWTTDVNLRTTYMSPSVERILGFKPEDRVGIEAAEAITPESLSHVQGLLMEQLELEREGTADPRRTVTVEMEYYRKDGSTIWLENQVSGLRDEHGTLIGFLAVARDMSERRRAEQAIRDSEAKYRDLFDHTLLGMEVVDGETGKTVLANRSLARIFGFKSPADMVGTNPLEYVLPEDLEWVAGQIAQLMTDPSWDRQATIRARTNDGRIIWLTGMTTPFEYEGKPGMLISLVDATAAKEAEIKLKESEERYRLLAENASDIIWVIDSELKITYVSPSVTTLLGYSVEEVVTRAFDKLLPPSSLATINRLYEDGLAEEESAPGSMTTTTVEIQVARKDGSTLWLEAAVSTIRDSEGRFAGFQGACRDISQRKRAEEDLRRAHAELEERVEERTAELKEANILLMQEIRQRQKAQERLQDSEAKYRELVESANTIILELDTRGKVTFFNRFAQEFFGFSESDILGRSVVGTIAPPMDSEGKDLKAQTRDLVKHPENYLVIENEGVRRSGERVWISWTNKGIYDAKGKLRNVLCIGMDRTEQRRVAEILEQQLKERVATEERQRLARDLHDAVTQTLFSASLVAEVLPRLWKRDRAEGARRLEELRRLTRGALAEMRMLLLELRPGALGEVGLANLLGQLVEATAAQAKLQVDLDLSGECDVPAEVQVALYRVAQEALNNVVKHSGAEEAKIRLACEGGSADLTVSDNGSGFDARAVSPESLGLRIMQERAEEVGATVKVEGRVGRGTRVRARWPGANRRGTHDRRKTNPADDSR